VSSRAARLETAANGRLALRFGSVLRFAWLRWKLRLLHGFRAEGRSIHGAGESITPDLVRGDLRLESGSDELGPYLLSCSEAADGFLRRLARGLE
jgi:hypothetical protein